MLELDPLLLTGDGEIDGQHRELFARIGALLEASQRRRSREEVVRLLEYMGDYVIVHFSTEERRMALARFPEAADHAGEHRAFVKEIETLRHELKTEGPTPLFVIRVGNRVTAWLREHIYRTDRRLAEWLRQGGR